MNTTVDPDVYHHPRRTHGWRVLASQTHHYGVKWWRVSLALGLWLTQLVPSILHAGVVLFRGQYRTRRKSGMGSGERSRAQACTLRCSWFTGIRLRELGSCGPNCHLCFAAHVIMRVRKRRTSTNRPRARRTTPMGGQWSMRASAGDYSTGSLFTGWLSIGLNNQAVHHVFPSVHHVHYRHVAKIVGHDSAALVYRFHDPTAATRKHCMRICAIYAAERQKASGVTTGTPEK